MCLRGLQKLNTYEQHLTTVPRRAARAPQSDTARREGKHMCHADSLQARADRLTRVSTPHTTRTTDCTHEHGTTRRANMCWPDTCSQLCAHRPTWHRLQVRSASTQQPSVHRTRRSDPCPKQACSCGGVQAARSARETCAQLLRCLEAPAPTERELLRQPSTWRPPSPSAELAPPVGQVGRAVALPAGSLPRHAAARRLGPFGAQSCILSILPDSPTFRNHVRPTVADSSS